MVALRLWRVTLNVALFLSFEKAKEQPNFCFCSEKDRKLLPAVP